MTLTSYSSTPKIATTPKGKRYVSPAISLNRPARRELNKDEVLNFKLRTDPKDKDSTTYELTIGYFSKGTAEELLLFLRSVKKILKGQDVTTGPTQYALMRRLLQGDALAAFNKAAKENATETTANYEKCVQALITHVLPRKALAIQKRYMRRFLRKPKDMKVREFMNRLVEVNMYLKEFPPFSAEGQELPDDEIMDIAEFAVPATWQKTMIMHGFNPTAGTPSEFVEFCERIEFSEPPSQDDQKDRAESKTSRKGGKDRAKSSERGATSNERKRKATMWCEYHQTDSHNTGKCKVMIAQAKKMRGTWEASREKTSYTRASSSNDSPKESRTNGKRKQHESHQVDLKEMMQKTFKEMFAQQHKMENFNVEDFKNFSLSEDESE
jgi:hypothetical protein